MEMNTKELYAQEETPFPYEDQIVSDSIAGRHNLHDVLHVRSWFCLRRHTFEKEMADHCRQRAAAVRGLLFLQVLHGSILTE